MKIVLNVITACSVVMVTILYSEIIVKDVKLVAHFVRDVKFVLIDKETAFRTINQYY